MINEYPVEISSLPLQPDDILKEMGYGKVQPGEELRLLVGTMLDEVKAIAAPTCVFRIGNGTVVPDKGMVHWEDTHTFTVGNVLSHLLDGSGQFALFTATAGRGFHQYQHSPAVAGDIMRSFVADVIGTCLVEAVGDRMERLLEQQIAPLRHTNRFSPGYCGWKLTEQKQLFALLGGAPCGIALNDSCLMIPEKSISGIIGIGTRVNEKAYGCHYCTLETCYKRKRLRKQS